MQSDYIIQSAEKSHCPKCGAIVDLIAMADATRKKTWPWFYICWDCKSAFEIGKGELQHEN